MDGEVMSAQEARARWRDVLDAAVAGKPVIVERHGKPVAAVISYREFEALREAMEDLEDARYADAVLQEIERDPSRLVDYDEFRRQLIDEGLLDE